MDSPAGPERAQKPWDHAWTTDEIREKRAAWNLAGDAGLLQHLQQFSDKLMTTANKTQEALNTFSSELDETIIFIDNITNTSLALANTQFIESRVCEDEIEAEPPKEQQLEAPKTKEQLDAELISSIGETVRRGIAIMEEKYETLEVIASDSEDEGETAIPSFILRPKDPYQDRPLPYIIGSEKWKNSSKIGLETSSSDSEHQEEDESESDSGDDTAAVSQQINNMHKTRIARLSSSSSESNDFNAMNNVVRNIDDRGSYDNQDIFGSENETSTAANSLPKNSTSGAPNFAEELAKRLGNVIPTQKSINSQVIAEPAATQPEDDLFTREDEDLFSAPSKNLFSEPTSLFSEKSPDSSLWGNKLDDPLQSSIIPSSFDAPPPISAVATKPKSAIDDLFGDADSEDSDNLFSSKPSMGKPFKVQNSPSNSLHTEDKPQSKNLLSVSRITEKKGMATSTPETNDMVNSLFGDEPEDEGNLFSGESSRKGWTAAKTSIPDKTTGSTPAEASNTSSKKKPVGGVSILGQIDIFASGKLRRQPSSESCSSQSSSDFETPRSRATNTRNDANSVINNDSSNGSSMMISGNTEGGESSGISLHPPSVDDVTASSNISPNFQPAMTSTWNKTGDMYRERIASDSLFAAKTLSRENENSMNNARIEEAPDPAEVRNSDIFLENDDIFGPPPLPVAGSKTEGKSKVASLFDDFDSDDDLFSNTSSGSRSQKSTDLLKTTATSRPSDRSNIFKNKGLFDDDESENAEESGSDIFGGKESSNVNLFASKTVEEVSVRSSKDEEKSEQVSSSTVVQQEIFSSSKFGKQNIEETQQTSSAANIGSIFDDLDDDDLFAPNFGKKISDSQRKMAPSLFDDGADDLFAAPKGSSLRKTETSSESVVKSGVNIGGQIKSKVMEQLAAKLEVANKTVEKTDVESKSGSDATVAGVNVERAINAEEEHSTLSKQDGDGISSTNKSKNLATKILNEMKTVQESKLLKADGKPGIAKKPEVSKKLNQRLDVVNKSDVHSKNVASVKSREIRSEVIEKTRTTSEGSSVKSFESERRISSSEGERSSTTSKSDNIYTEQETSSTSSFKSEEISSIDEKREPPKTLEIRPGEKPNAVQRRVVSGKIKNLMGRMSDLKILSPTDSPPVWRKNEDKVEDEADKDSADGSCSSTSRKTPTPTLPADEPSKTVALRSSTEQKEIEPAISFDQPVQVETLSVTASKSRVRIQTKRRPQSRHARQNALRKSGIDFDSVDFATDNNSDKNRNLSSNSENNNPSMTEKSVNFENTVNSNNDRLIISTGISESVSVRVTDSTSSTFIDDRSEISFSKESTLSMNKNTLLSPSTDEEDLFDVPPDLPEDPPKEDNLFGRAPILSPVESFVKVEKTTKHETSKSENLAHSQKREATMFSDQFETSSNQIVTKESFSGDTKKEDVKKWETTITGEEIRADKNTSIIDEKSSAGEANSRAKSQEQKYSGTESKAESRAVSKQDEKKKELIDPLCDVNHDPLKDPSNLFPFVTKTPSPEKGKNLLFDDDDDGLFSNSSSKKLEHGKLRATDESKTTTSTAKKQSLDIFAEDSETDFFTTVLPKSVRRSRQESKIDLFADDDNQDDDLFGGDTKKLTNKSSAKSSRSVTTEEKITKTESSSKSQSIFGEIGKEKTLGSQKTTGAKVRSETKKATTTSGIFSDDDSAEIFTVGSKTKPAEGISTGKKIVEDIFGGQSSGDEDMFARKKTVIKKPTTSSGLFDDDDDNEGGEELFGKSTTSYVSRSESVEKRGIVKKAATRDLKKTAEQIVEDPLSMLQKD